MIMFDSSGSLNTDREDIKNDPRHYRKWELCLKTNSKKIKSIEDAIKGADVLIALSTPGPDTIKREWVRSMADKAIVLPAPTLCQRYGLMQLRRKGLTLSPQDEEISQIR